MRRTDFLPVGPDVEDEVLDRGYESMDSDVDEHDEFQYAMQAASHQMDDEVGELADPDGNELHDFI